MKKLLALTLVLSLCCSLLGCKEQESTPVSTAPKAQEQQEAGLVILYTADVHGVLSRPEYSSEKSPMGYGALKAYADQLTAEGKTVLLVDGGDAGVGRQLLDQLGYFAAVPGEDELTLGTEQLKNAKADYICCNLLDENTGEPVLAPYKITDCGKKQVAFVGITRLEQEEQAFYDCVQNAIDMAQNEGADFVIAVGYLGAEPGDSPCTSADVIANTSGLTAFLDARSHVVTEGQTLKDGDDKDVPILAVGSELTNIGRLDLDLNKGTVTAILINGLTEDNEEILSAVEDVLKEQESTV